MSRRSGGRTAIIGGMVGVVVVAAVFRGAWRPLLEWWYLRQLESPDPEAVEAAVHGLAEVGSARAVPALLIRAARNLEAL